MLGQSLPVTSGMPYVSHRQRNLEINKAVNQLQSQGRCLHVKTAFGLRLTEKVYLWYQNVFK